MVFVGAGVKGTVNVATDPSAPGLPIPPTTLIGRARDLEVVTEHLRRARLLTLRHALPRMSAAQNADGNELTQCTVRRCEVSLLANCWQF